MSYFVFHFAAPVAAGALYAMVRLEAIGRRKFRIKMQKVRLRIRMPATV